MKQGLLGILFLIAVAANGQPAMQVFGFSQTHTPGNIRREPGSLPDKSWQQKITYFLYLAIKPTITIQPRDVWIQGKHYSITYSRASAPVYIDGKKLQTAAGNTRILQIKQNGPAMKDQSQNSVIRKLVKDNELVIGYSYKGKKYYQSLRKIKQLEPILGE